MIRSNSAAANRSLKASRGRVRLSHGQGQRSRRLCRREHRSRFLGENNADDLPELFFSPDGPAALRANTARLRVPLLWIAGKADFTQNNARAIFDTARNPKNLYQTVSTDHLRTPNASAAVILPWLKRIAQQ